MTEERKANPITAAFNRKALLDAVVKETRKKFLINEGEPVLIPLQEESEGKLVTCPPHEALIATQPFYRDELTFAFYALYPGYRSTPIFSYNDLMFMNIARLKYAEFLKDKGLVRVAEPGEVTREVIQQTISNLKTVTVH